MGNLKIDYSEFTNLQLQKLLFIFASFFL